MRRLMHTNIWHAISVPSAGCGADSRRRRQRWPQVHPAVACGEGLPCHPGCAAWVIVRQARARRMRFGMLATARTCIPAGLGTMRMRCSSPTSIAFNGLDRTALYWPASDDRRPERRPRWCARSIRTKIAAVGPSEPPKSGGMPPPGRAAGVAGAPLRTPKPGGMAVFAVNAAIAVRRSGRRHTGGGPAHPAKVPVPHGGHRALGPAIRNGCGMV